MIERKLIHVSLMITKKQIGVKLWMRKKVE
jgi:hypothetical protein